MKSQELKKTVIMLGDKRSYDTSCPPKVVKYIMKNGEDRFNLSLEVDDSRLGAFGQGLCVIMGPLGWAYLLMEPWPINRQAYYAARNACRTLYKKYKD